ncbi:MAG: 3-hydroxyacyl-CoA dehydrogenase NAD-binding domain-containing protein [Burkholderiaceae bacterium]
MTTENTAATAPSQTMRFWSLETCTKGIAWASLNVKEASLNKLSAEVLDEFRQMLDAFDKSPPKALVIQSGKANGFIAGADIEEFKTLDSAQKVQGLIARGWHLFNRFARVPYPTLALIRGVCLGGGLELALACRYRIAVDQPSTKLGLPEVMLGILPGWGGMKRLPELVGPQMALDMMLTGKTIDARRARKAGLVDLAVAERVAKLSAEKLVLSGQPKARAKGIKALLNHPLLRPIVARMARKQAMAKARPEHYPAPFAIIDTWEKADGDSLKDPSLLNGIVTTPTALNLVRVFFLQERLKGIGKAGRSTEKGHLHVVGAGTMGGDIAAWAALRGFQVTLQDQDLSRIAPAFALAHTLFSRRIRDPYLLKQAKDRLQADPEGHGIRKATVIIEAIFENLEAKQALFRRLEAEASPQAILATNTSSLKLEDIRECLKEPERLVGIHFFNPVAQMPLVEVIHAEGTREDVLTAATGFVRDLDKLPLPVKSAPGFLVNAVLAPYMLAAMRKVDEGLSAASIDAAMTRFGMPMGPLELADTVGLDIALAAGSTIAQARGEDLSLTVPRCLKARVDAKQLGKKTSQGFYVWKDGKREDVSGSKATGSGSSSNQEALALALIEPLVTAAQELVRQGVVEDADLADAGIIFGTGFAPFRGGPLHWWSSQDKGQTPPAAKTPAAPVEAVPS